MGLESFMVGEINQTEKDNYCMILYVEYKKILSREDRLVISDPGGEWKVKWVNGVKKYNFQL